MSPYFSFLSHVFSLFRSHTRFDLGANSAGIYIYPGHLRITWLSSLCWHGTCTTQPVILLTVHSSSRMQAHLESHSTDLSLIHSVITTGARNHITTYEFWNRRYLHGLDFLPYSFIAAFIALCIKVTLVTWGHRGTINICYEVCWLLSTAFFESRSCVMRLGYFWNLICWRVFIVRGYE